MGNAAGKKQEHAAKKGTSVAPPSITYLSEKQQDVTSKVVPEKPLTITASNSPSLSSPLSAPDSRQAGAPTGVKNEKDQHDNTTVKQKDARCSNVRYSSCRTSYNDSYLYDYGRARNQQTTHGIPMHHASEALIQSVSNNQMQPIPSNDKSGSNLNNYNECPKSSQIVRSQEMPNMRIQGSSVAANKQNYSGPVEDSKRSNLHAYNCSISNDYKTNSDAPKPRDDRWAAGSPKHPTISLQPSLPYNYSSYQEIRPLPIPPPKGEERTCCKAKIAKKSSSKRKVKCKQSSKQKVISEQSSTEHKSVSEDYTPLQLDKVRKFEELMKPNNVIKPKVNAEKEIRRVSSIANSEILYKEEYYDSDDYSDSYIAEETSRSVVASQVRKRPVSPTITHQTPPASSSQRIFAQPLSTLSGVHQTPPASSSQRIFAQPPSTPSGVHRTLPATSTQMICKQPPSTKHKLHRP